MSRLDRVAIASRVFCIAAITGLAAIATSPINLQGAAALFCVGVAAAAASLVRRIPATFTVVVEALLAASIVGYLLPDGLLLLPYLVVPPLIAGLVRGVVPVLLVMVAQAIALLVPAVLEDRVIDLLDIAAPWMLTSLGIGLLGSWLRQIGKSPLEPVVDPSYESARRLLTQLRVVARRLSAGLDPVGMAAQTLTLVSDHLPSSQAAVFVRTEGGVLSPLGYSGTAAREDFLADDQVIDRCWAEMEPVAGIRPSGRADRRYRTVLPLRVGARMIGVVVSDAHEAADPEVLNALMPQIDEHSLRLDTALAFDEVRSVATAEERRRLAREIHDGVAQEVASLGYTVDDLAAQATDRQMAARLRKLRADLSNLVSELRLSIFDLRNEVDSSSGLGSALSEYVRTVGTRSNMTVHLTLDEAPTRLRAEVETELLRITQEAITNARKHSAARNLWVHCRVQPPMAHIEVRDDGVGMGGAGEDAYGLRIMKERAQRIDADLHVGVCGDTPNPGTAVTVTLGAKNGHNGHQGDER